MGKKRGGADGPKVPGWMVTFGDMTMLLLIFFVLMLSMASLDKTKFNKMTGSIKSAFGIIELVTQNDSVTPTIEEEARTHDDLVQQVYEKTLIQMRRLQINEEVELVKDRGAVILRINEAVLFATGQSQLKPEAEPILQKVAALVKPLPLNMRIEGHADNQGEILANWEISVARAVAVLKFFVVNKLFPLERLSAVGYGDQRPVVPNDTPESMAKNRRVEFFLESVGGYTEQLPTLIDASEKFPF